ncbi:splicing regulatory glutamine/lysine-rich protein 1-like [Ostrinia furnacalis]|uniref:splicing regulatory glutamine/lysine-rich protein 1-like n=1 Tax=Ostrinia furnacalis TaxID=93504 RepID=UPI00103E10F8|nr:splicing regulatory glutamine/lysine-rich protein 1-like [Ostrinia furnacalis]
MFVNTGVNLNFSLPGRHSASSHRNTGATTASKPSRSRATGRPTSTSTSPSCARKRRRIRRGRESSATTRHAQPALTAHESESQSERRGGAGRRRGARSDGTATVKVDFIALLKEKAVDRHARYPEVKKKIDSDARYKAVESSSVREDYFREYCKLVKEERKKEKDGKEKAERADRSSKKDKKDKDRDKDKDKERASDKDGKKKKEKAEVSDSH